MRLLLLFSALLICCLFLSAESSTEHISNKTETIHLVTWNFHHLQVHITITVFIFSIVIVLLMYEYMEVISSVIPESCILIIIGVIFGAVLKYGLQIDTRQDVWELNPNVFLLILLPPIVLDAAHNLSQRAFADVFGPVMVFAFFATILNFLAIGFALYGLNYAGAMGQSSKISISHCLLFGSLIVAVDPVAVLAIFEELGVDKTLYFLVFGESLFNDAVTIVLYNMMTVFVKMETVGTTDIVLGVFSFVTVSLGGALVGIVFGIISCLITRFSNQSRLLQPIIIVVVAYMSYLAGDLFGWSGIISMIACGILQATYAFHNLTEKSLSTTRRLLKMTSKLSESMVFLYLGIEITRGNLKWDTGFVLWSLALCLIVRFTITFVCSAILNKSGSVLKRISLTEQFIIGYGGLRGAVAFSLATLIKDDVFIQSELQKDHFLTATLFIILFTIFPMGITMKPLVRVLKIHLEESHVLSVFDEINNNIMDHFSAGIEAITGIKGHNLFREWIDRIDTKYIRPILQRDPDEHSQRIIQVYEKVALTLHYASIDHNHSSTKYIDRLCSPLKEKFLHDCNHSYEELCCREKQLHHDAHRRSIFHNVSSLFSFSDSEHHKKKKKQPFATQGRLSLRRDVASDDYAGIFKASTQQPNVLTRVNTVSHEEFSSKVEEAIKRKHKYFPNIFRHHHHHHHNGHHGHHGHHHRHSNHHHPHAHHHAHHNRHIYSEISENCSLPHCSSVDGISFRSHSEFELCCCKEEETVSHTCENVPEIVIEPQPDTIPRFHVPGDDEEDDGDIVDHF